MNLVEGLGERRKGARWDIRKKIDLDSDPTFIASHILDVSFCFQLMCWLYDFSSDV